MKKILSGTLAAAIAMTSLAAASPAEARDHHRGSDYGYGYSDYDYRDYRGADYRRNRDYYRNDRRYYRGQRCDKGTGGTIIGAIVGGLLGNEVVGRRGDRTAGAIVGAGVGALAGRAIDRSDGRRC
jgi:uncharacterized protein YcfJ